MKGKNNITQTKPNHQLKKKKKKKKKKELGLENAKM
jgi:hypothetical protein